MKIGRLDWSRIVPQIVAPIAALAFAATVTSIALVISGKSPGTALSAMIDFGLKPDSMVAILNKATPYYIAAIAVAIGFRMGLFNIGVDGQYRLAGLLSAALGAASFLSWLPGVIRILIMIIASMAVAALWAAIAGILKVT